MGSGISALGGPPWPPLAALLGEGFGPRRLRRAMTEAFLRGGKGMRVRAGCLGWDGGRWFGAGVSGEGWRSADARAVRRGFTPGTTHTQSVGDLPVAQDGPPPGGFPSVRYGRRIPNTGPSGAVVFGLVCLGMGYGFYKTAQYNRYQNRLTEEKINTRMALTPFLQAEADRVFVQRQAKFHAWEAEVMKDVPGWEVGKNVYNSRWVPPADPSEGRRNFLSY